MSAEKNKNYRRRIRDLIEQLEANTELGVRSDIQVNGKVPTNATSEFLINKEQGDWAERLVCQAINHSSLRWIAVPYGIQDGRSAGDHGFAEYYLKYQEELNALGKRPDLLIFSRQEFPHSPPDVADESVVRRAVAALEVRSSSFLEKKYRAEMAERNAAAIRQCEAIRKEILEGGLSEVLREKNPDIHKYMIEATAETFRNISFRKPSWSTSEALRILTAKLAEFRECLKVLQKRDFLSITPKVEDIALVNRWVQHYGVRHYYVQVFFDGAFVLPFEDIVRIAGDSSKEELVFRIEKDVKNQAKTTIKVSVDVARSLIPSISMPEHKSDVKELDRGRLLFFVKFVGGVGVLDEAALDALLQ